MSWIEKELRRREKQEHRERKSEAGKVATLAPVPDTQPIADLWQRIESTNNALPEKLRLRRELANGKTLPPDRAMCGVLLLAKEGSGIGFAGDAIRSFWPGRASGRSNNFWIRWLPERGYFLARRKSAASAGMVMQERAFNEEAIDHILRCLVTDTRVTFRSVARRRLWIF